MKRRRPRRRRSAMDRGARAVDVFFYGLYMDEAVLAAKGIPARNARKAFVEDWTLAIGKRAALVPQAGARAYGMVFALTHDEIERLYAGLEAYRPEAVLARALPGAPLPALCMNLPEAPAPEERDAEYAGKLRAVMQKLGLPSGSEAADSSAHREIATVPLPQSRTGVAPDGSDFRSLLAAERGGMAHFELAPGETSKAIAHASVEEIWFILSGRGEMWRRRGEREETAALEPGVCLAIPPATRFQFRALGGEPLRAVAVTMPPWPGDDEASVVEGPWRPTLR